MNKVRTFWGSSVADFSEGGVSPPPKKGPSGNPDVINTTASGSLF